MDNNEKHKEYKDWEETELASSISRFPERKDKFTNHGGEEIDRLAVPGRMDEEYLAHVAEMDARFGRVDPKIRIS